MKDAYRRLVGELENPKAPRTSYRLGNANLYGSEIRSIGVKIPYVKEVAARYAADPSLSLADFSLTDSVELTICFFIIGLRRCVSFDEKMAFLRERLPCADSWAVTDVCPQFIKPAPLGTYLPYYREFIASPYPFVRRFAYVYALSYRRDEKAASFIGGIKKESEYYVTMAEAWLLATLAIDHYGDVLAFLKSKRAYPALFRKTISKCRDSFRIPAGRKEELMALREERKRFVGVSANKR
ncbi:MAG: DNA alkylation repair protein [Bacilli bacterium]|jgi:3-methyladenine DNA glycosylase AlkD|nr:DNA alkylation repair protein [Bacilli bacterium]